MGSVSYNSGIGGYASEQVVGGPNGTVRAVVYRTVGVNEYASSSAVPSPPAIWTPDDGFASDFGDWSLAYPASTDAQAVVQASATSSLDAEGGRQATDWVKQFIFEQQFAEFRQDDSTWTAAKGANSRWVRDLGPDGWTAWRLISEVTEGWIPVITDVNPCDSSVTSVEVADTDIRYFTEMRVELLVHRNGTASDPEDTGYEYQEVVPIKSRGTWSDNWGGEDADDDAQDIETRHGSYKVVADDTYGMVIFPGSDDFEGRYSRPNGQEGGNSNEPAETLRFTMDLVMKAYNDLNTLDFVRFRRRTTGGAYRCALTVSFR